MECLFLIKYGEISLKGKNRSFFLKRLQANIKKQLKNISTDVTIRNGRLYLRIEQQDLQYAQAKLSRVFGVMSYSQARKTPKSVEAIRETAVDLARDLAPSGGTFKIEARRTDKSFPLDSYGIASLLGDAIRAERTDLTVDLKNPQWIMNVEIRDSAYLYGKETKGVGGLPVGCSGRGFLLLSGGIDSPVAGYLMAKRGLRIDCVYFHTPPFTAESVKEKVTKLAKILCSYLPTLSLHIVPYTEIQLKIKQEAEDDQVTLLSRACMMEIASLAARRNKASCVITGESLGQVASQTLRSMAFTESRSRLPVFRPLIGLDKEEIIRMARRIGTYETSILPYPDCCTLFASPHPLTHPDTAALTGSYEDLELEQMVIDASRSTEILRFDHSDLTERP
jgi:thiamine biosynthesis protein ThiI